MQAAQWQTQSYDGRKRIHNPASEITRLKRILQVEQIKITHKSLQTNSTVLRVFSQDKQLLDRLF